MMIGTKKQENIMDLKDKLTAEQRDKILAEWKSRIKQNIAGMRSTKVLEEILTTLTARPVAWKDMPPSSFGVDFGATLESDTEPEDGEE